MYNLPLTVEQATAYINETGTPISDCLSIWRQQDQNAIELLSGDFEEYGRHRNSRIEVTATWLISYEKIRAHCPLAIEYLSFMACLNSKNIPQSLRPPAASPKAYADAVGIPDTYSFITGRPEDAALDLHPLLHLITRNRLRKQGLLVPWVRKAVLSAEASHYVQSCISTRKAWMKYIPHAQDVLDLVG